MNIKELGEIIKEARIAKKMTQSEVVGDFITRNMLSQIESGNAMPSLKTLEYLADILDLPLHRLIVGEKEDELSKLIKAKQLLDKGAYEDIIQMEEDYPLLLADEFCAIFSHAFLGLSKVSWEKEDFAKAAALSQKAIEYSRKGIYSNETVKSESVLILNLSAEKLMNQARIP